MNHFLIDDFIEDFMNFVEFLTGKKTYIVALLIALATMAQYMGWITNEAYTAILGLLGASGLATTRMAIKKIND